MTQLKIVTFLLLISHAIVAQEIQIALHDNWTFRQVGKTDWENAEVPGTVHTNLLNNNRIEDPFYGINRSDLQWIAHEDWEYKTVFNAGEEVITKDKIFLEFQGLDTYAEVYLNDSLILTADNMFRSWNVDISYLIEKGENQLNIYFRSPIRAPAPMSGDRVTDGGMEVSNFSSQEGTFFPRKALYHFDWGLDQGFVTSGIWRPIILRAWDSAQFKDVFIEQKILTETSASLLAHLEYEVTRPFIGELELLIDGKTIKKSIVELPHGTLRDNISFTIDNPELWWPNGLGRQKLYEIEFLLKREQKTIDAKRIRTGLRTIELIRKNDKNSPGFYFKVNGKPVFIKGANYVPQDYFLTRMKHNSYTHLLQSAADANMNMIRVWGGGIYENSIFYELCDEKGLLVWQDFMFAKAPYPKNGSFLENIRFEVEENILRLRHHPCIAVWAGNRNEATPWQLGTYSYNVPGKQVVDRFESNEDDSLRIASVSADIFEIMLPNAVKAYGLGVPYLDSFQLPKQEPTAFSKETNLDHWYLSSMKVPFLFFGSNGSRFRKAFDVRSYPQLETIKSFTPEANLTITSEIVQTHMQPAISKTLISSIIEEHFNKPKDFESFIYISQLLQAEMTKMTIEEQRIKTSHSIGSFVLQLNDSWPAVSRSSIDYYGRWKAMHYYLKRAFSDVMVIFEEDEEEIRIHGISDQYEEKKANLIVDLIDFNGKVIISEDKKFRLKANSGHEIWKRSKKDLLKKQPRNEVYLRARIVSDQDIIAENIFTFVPHKALQLEPCDIKYDFIEQNGRLLLELKSNKAALGVCMESGDLDLPFSDNFFTLHAREPKVIEIFGDTEAFEIRNKLTVKSLIDAF